MTQSGSSFGQSDPQGMPLVGPWRRGLEILVERLSADTGKLLMKRQNCDLPHIPNGAIGDRTAQLLIQLEPASWLSSVAAVRCSEGLTASLGAVQGTIVLRVMSLRPAEAASDRSSTFLKVPLVLRHDCA